MNANILSTYCPNCNCSCTLTFENSDFFRGITYKGRCPACDTTFEVSFKRSAAKPIAPVQVVLSYLQGKESHRATIDSIIYDLPQYDSDQTLIDLARDGFVSEHDTGWTTLYILTPQGANLLASLNAGGSPAASESTMTLEEKLAIAIEALDEVSQRQGSSPKTASSISAAIARAALAKIL